MRWRLRLHGIVQGVGFRPFVYRLSRRFSLSGFVRNEGGDVIVEVQGETDQLQRWRTALLAERPAISRIDAIDLHEIPVVSEPQSGFHIDASAMDSAPSTPSPDLSLCDECRAELHDPANRRYQYPFTNCTLCGPRFTIIRRMPYDRENTTMRSFPLCDRCAREYATVQDRRFHAEPIACAECGPRLQLFKSEEEFRHSADILDHAAKALLSGKIVAIKAIGGWHLACDATDENAVKTLRERKQRQHQPFAVMFPDLAALRRYACVDDDEIAMLRSPVAPIVLLDPLPGGAALAPSVSSSASLLGVMLPSTPLHELILRRTELPLVMTSGNRSGAPTPFRDETFYEELVDMADLILTHDRPILLRCDDSIVRLYHDGKKKRTVHYRKARGFAPDILKTPFVFDETVFAAGSFLNNTFAFASGSRVFLSPHLGDLDHPDTIEQYSQLVDHYSELFSLQPVRYVSDLHDRYPSTIFAENRAANEGASLIRVQHHEAHIASCLAENAHTGAALGLALDGTGLGRDGTSWGGELFLFQEEWFRQPEQKIRRVGSLVPLRMPGADLAVIEPYRMALGLLYHSAGSEAVKEARRLGRFEQLDEKTEGDLLRAMPLFPLTSGCGRLFDAVSYMLSGKPYREYEGEPAIWLEDCLTREAAYENLARQSAYGFGLHYQEKRLVIDPGPMCQSLLYDLKAGINRRTIALRFHSGLIRSLIDLVEEVAEETGLRTVALSGGCFFNRYLSIQLVRELERREFVVLQHLQLPPGDGGLAFGQLMLSGAAIEYN